MFANSREFLIWSSSCLLWLLLAGSVAGASPARSAPPSQPLDGALTADQPPRKVVLATLMSRAQNRIKNLSDRLTYFENLFDVAAAQARQKYPGAGLDLVVMPETALTTGMPGNARERAIPFEGEVQQRMGRKARQHRTYLIVTMVLREGDPSDPFYSNAAVVLDRSGEPIGIYRKVFPVAYLHSDVLEGGVTPGDEFPVFDCDFGRLGIQICWDMSYPDGWEALAERGAEVVALPTASPQTVRPAGYAISHGYYVVSSTGTNNATVFNPIGRIDAQITEPGVLVHQIDLSYAILHWSPPLHEGRLLKDRYGDRVGFNFFPAEGTGVFWSNDLAMPIKTMIRKLGLEEMHEQIARNRVLQDAARSNRIAVGTSVED